MLVFLTGFVLRAWNAKSDAVPIEPPHHPVSGELCILLMHHCTKISQSLHTDSLCWAFLDWFLFFYFFLIFLSHLKSFQ